MKKIILILALLLALGACKNNTIDVKSKTFYTYFDTVSVISSYANDDEETFNNNVDKIENILNKYHNLFDTFLDHDINGLYKLNKQAGNKALVIDKDLMKFLLFSKEMYEVSGGSVNVLMGSITSIWKKAISDKKLPDEDELLSASKHTGIDLLVLDENNNTAYISDENASIDAGALAKGYVCKIIKEELGDILNGYTINLGGNILIIGEKSDGSNFNVGIEDPFDTNNILLKYELSDVSIVTSGNYERYFESDGIRYHHIIDPSTNYPSQKWASVTIIYKDSAICDALSTALFSLDFKKGKEILANYEDIKAVFVDLDGNIKEYSN